MNEPNRRSLIGASLHMARFGVMGGILPVLFMGAPLWAPLASGLFVFTAMALSCGCVIGYQKVRTQ